MSDSGDPPPELSVESVGLYLTEAVLLMNTLEAACINERPEYEPLPRGMLTCGEVCRIVPAVIAMSLHLYPQLAEDGVLEAILRNAMTTGTTGAVN